MQLIFIIGNNLKIWVFLKGLEGIAGLIQMGLLMELKHLRDQLELTEKVHKVIDNGEGRPQTPAEKCTGNQDQTLIC